MNNLRGIHETVIKDIIEDIIDIGLDTKDKISSDGTTSLTRMSSIARSSSALTAVFPVVCSTSIDPSVAMKITKAVEAKAVTMLQITFTAAQITNASNAFDYLKKFHTNLDDRATFDDFSLALDSLDLNESSVIDPRDAKMVYEDCRGHLNYYFEDDIRESSLNDYTITNRNGYINVFNHNVGYALQEAQAKPTNYATDDYWTNTRWMRDQDDRNDQIERNIKRDEYDKNRDEREKNKDDREAQRNEREKQKLDIDQYNLETNKITNRLMNSDVKKANDMNPTLMLINFRNSNGEKDSQAVIGVKAKLYPVNSDDVIKKIISKHQDGNVLLNFIRATTRETSFVKDFLFAIDKAKIDAISNSKKSSASIFKALERRSLRGKIRKALKSNNLVKCIATLVISTEEAEEIQKYSHIDILDERIAIKIMERLSLLFFIVVDHASETIKYLEDGQLHYETYTFDAMDKESGDFSYKKVVNLITKMAR